MNGRVLEGLGRWLRLRPPGRDILVRDDDTFLTSYPRSGNTWVRFILANLLDPGNSDSYSFVRVNVPDIYKEKARVIDGLPSPRVLKSHEYFDPRYRRVIYLVRDPRAVAVSYFHQQMRFGVIPPDTTLETFVGRFIAGGADGFGTWSDHVESWLNTAGKRDSFFLLRYEELATDGVARTIELARFLKLSSSEEEIRRAFKRSSIERMKSLEKAEANDDELPAHTTFVRRGGVETWRDELGDKEADAITSSFGDTMKKLGYAVQ